VDVKPKEDLSKEEKTEVLLDIADQLSKDEKVEIEIPVAEEKEEVIQTQVMLLLLYWFQLLIQLLIFPL
jgi:hypothetical protein